MYLTRMYTVMATFLLVFLHTEYHDLKGLKKQKLGKEVMCWVPVKCSQSFPLLQKYPPPYEATIGLLHHATYQAPKE